MCVPELNNHKNEYSSKDNNLLEKTYKYLGNNNR